MKHKTDLKETVIGKIPEDWVLVDIGDLFNVKNGKTNSQDAIEGGKYPLFDRSTQIKLSNKYLFDSEAIIMPGEGKEFIPRYFYGKFDLHQRVYAITPKTNDVCLKFFYYWMYYYRDFLARIAVGSTVKSLRLNHLLSFPAPKPNLLEQQAIAKVLSDLDSKIELNNQINSNLEAMAQAIFKHWFVDFEFPDEKGNPYKASGGKMIESQLQEIPKNWKIAKLGKFIRIERGLSYNGAGLTETGLPMINLGTVGPNGSFVYNGLKFYSGEYKERNLVKAGDIVIANTDITQNREVLGSAIIVPKELGSDKILFTHHIYAVRNDSKLPNIFIYYLFQTHEYRNRARGYATGTTVLALPEDAILNLDFIIPDDITLKHFEALVNPIRAKFSENIIENKKLVSIRDSLLPKLMSGKIRVPMVTAK